MYLTLIMLLSDSVEESQARVDALVVQLSASQPIAALYPALLEQVLVASDSSTVSSRTKSLRALSLIVAQDPELFVRVRPFPTCPS
jgi:cohesin loading factor subunit SCC2